MDTLFPINPSEKLIIKGSCPRFVNRGKPKTKERCHKEIYKYGVCKYHYFKNRGFTGK